MNRKDELKQQILALAKKNIMQKFMDKKNLFEPGKTFCELWRALF